MQLEFVMWVIEKLIILSATKKVFRFNSLALKLAQGFKLEYN